ncbi:hypothetical protein BGX34_005921 [Mortierella sp. NVP85]|nr:hypothetical protein BGX34_005921 [Mortierella sp. NVP85]
MNLSPTSLTLFLVQIGTFFSGFIVVVCCCLYFSAYPKSPDAGKVSGIAVGTLAFALVSTITTLVLIVRQKSGRTINAKIEGVWVGVAIALWTLAAVGGIAKPANNMRNVTCKVLPSGDDTDDKNYKRACQSMFASTAFCILSVLFYIVTAVILITFSIQKAVREKKAAQVKVGGNYQLGPSPSQYRRAEQAFDVPTEEPKDEEATSPSTDPATTAVGTSVLSPATAATTTTTTTSTTEGGHFSKSVYQDPTVSTAEPAATLAAGTVASPYANSGHVPQASYQSTVGGYNTGGYFGHGGQASGHVQQGSAISNISVSPYHTQAGSSSMYPPQPTHQPYPQGGYPMMGTLNQNSPYANQYMNQPSGPQTPIMEMPRPEHF